MRYRLLIDVILGELAFEQSSVDSAVDHDVGGIFVPLPRVEDLMIMKHPAVDVEADPRWVREFATANAMPDLLDDFDKPGARRRAGGCPGH
jgi:hypothetical protein